MKETVQLGCLSHDSTQRKSMLRENGKLGSTHAVKFSKATMRFVKIREKKGPWQGIIQKCEPQDRNPWAPKFEERTQDETLKQEQCAWQRMSTNSRRSQKDTFYSPAEAWVMPAPSSTKPEETFRGRIFIFSSLCSCSKILLPYCPLASFAKSTVTLRSGTVAVSRV